MVGIEGIVISNPVAEFDVNRRIALQELFHFRLDKIRLHRFVVRGAFSLYRIGVIGIFDRELLIEPFQFALTSNLMLIIAY